MRPGSLASGAAVGDDLAVSLPSRQELKVGVLSRLARFVYGALSHTYRVTLLEPTYAQRRAAGEDVRCIYAAWHGDLWCGLAAIRSPEVCLLASRHRDGELITRVLKMMGHPVVRGSSTRGGAAATRELVRFARELHGDLAVTMDGPRGPYRELKEGTLFLASRTGLPIVPSGLWVGRAWRLGSWDRMAIGKPFTRVVLAFEPPLVVPRDASREELRGVWRERLATAMDRAEERARAAAAGACLPERV